MEKWRWTLSKALLAVAAFSLSGLWPGPSSAQIAQRVRPRPAAGSESADEDAGPGNFAPPNRNLLQALQRSQKVLKEHRFGEALEGLSQILRSNEDDSFFQPDHKRPTYKSLKAEARELLGQMPREGRDLYEVRCGAEARDKLNRAVAAGDDKGLSEISAQLFHTQAGYEATYLLALYHMDHGAPLAGALTLKRLRDAGAVAEAFEPGLSLTQAACYFQAGMSGECRQVLVDLKGRMGKPGLLLAGREVPWFAQGSEAPAWLAQLTGLQRMAVATETDRWAMFRGDAARNASTAGSAPLLNLRWRIEVADDPLQKVLKEQEDSYRNNGAKLFAGLHPLAVGDAILMRTAKYLLAVDFHTGKRLWQTEPDEDPADTPSNHFNGRFVRQNMSQQAQYGQRIWDDATYGTLSSDGRLVFVIEELPLGVGGPNMGFIMFAGNGRNDASNRSITNKLAAYDIKTGKIQWWLGGQDALPMPEALRGAFFLGPPLPLRGQLYVMAEVKGEIRLFALDGATGKLLWQQQLTMVESKITEDPLRRLAGVSPSYSDGVLICPTGSGCVVAVDLATRSLLWGYIYSHTAETVPGIGMGMGVGMARRIRGNQIQMAFNNNSNGPMPRWLDGTATIVNGRVLLTPAEADSLYCLNLADGKPAWAPQPRGEHYYIASVHKGVIALVGRNSIDAVNLEDGGKAWGGRTINMPAGAGVCGHGCYAGGQYFLPLSSGEVMTVDLEAGKVLATAKPRCSAVPGNLVCYRGRVVSQGFDGLELYYQVDAARDDAARRLAVNPDDVEGLTLRGEMFLDAGKSTEAVADFRRAYSLVDKKSERAPGSRNEEEFCRVPGRGRTREMLRDALLAGLRDDFAAHRAMAGEVEPLLDDTAQRATFLRYMASGMDRAHDWRQAVEYYLKLVDLEETKPALEKIDRSYLVRRDCWVEARLGMLREAGGAEAAAQLDRALEQRLAEAKMDTGFDGLKRFLGFFGNQPQAAAARAELLGRATQGKRILEAELLMAAGVDSGDRKAQAALLADMALLNFGAGRVSDAAACFRHLQRQYADVPCHAGMTSSQWLAVFPGGDALRQEVDRPAPAWPLGEVQAGPPDTNQNPFNRGQHFDMQLGGCGGPFFSDSTVSCEANRQEISLRDGLGHVQKSVPLVENGRVFGGGYNPYSTLARSCGHLLVASVGTKICGLDPWKAGGNTSSVLWCHDLFENPNDNGGNVIFFNNGMADGRANSFGPVNARYVCYQRMRSLVAVDPLTGEQMWVRHDIPAHSEVFGDEQYVFVLSPDSSEVSAYSPFQPAFGVPRRSEAAPSSDNNEASVYRAIDGQLLGKRKIPRPKLAANAPFNAFRNFGRWGNSMLDDAGIDFLGRNVLTWESGANGRVLALFDPWRQQAVWPSRTFAAGARVSMVGNEAVGVLEPGGHFVMLALADGRTLADLKLDARPNFSVTDLIVARMGDQYIVLAHDGNVGNALQDQMMQMPQGMLCVPLRRARIYALDLQGKPAWPAPVDVDHQQFLLSQPGRLPVLVFAAYHFENRGGQMNNWRSSVVAVDRRNGRIVHEKDCGPMRGMGVEVSGDPTEKTVRIAFNNETVVLTFTDKPVKTTVRHSTGVKKPSGKLGEALLEAVQGAAGMQQ